MAKLNLDSFTPEEEGRQKSFVSEENTRKHIGDNPKGLYCRRYKVDGYILTERDGKKCDYLLLNDNGKDAYFIELKGSRIGDAPEQIETTVRALKDSLSGYYIFCRVICSKASTHSIKSNTIIAWERKYNKRHHGQQTVVIKESEFTDKMTQDGNID